MNLDSLVSMAKRRGASDLHLEPGLPAALRIQGQLVAAGEPLSAGLLLGLVREAVGDPGWEEFRQRGSYDIARLVSGVRCRIHALHSLRGAGLAVRLLSSLQPTLASLNLHPDLERLVRHPHGLVLVSGPTGSGKSSTLAALLQEINRSEARHIVTIESPIEYELKPLRAFIRQREVERDTPSFEQALRDALREDPNVIMVGELREPETMRLTLNAAETGHLVLATVHSSNSAEALQRVVLAFPAEIQSSIASQLADSLVAVVCQRLLFRPEIELRVPECEILLASSGARGAIRAQEFYKLLSIIESGGQDGMWTFARYRAWLDKRSDWARPAQEPEAESVSTEAPAPRRSLAVAVKPATQRKPAATSPETSPEEQAESDDRVLVIQPPEADMAEILSELEGKPKRR